MSVLSQTINPGIGFIIHILSERITCYLRYVWIFTERCEVMLLSSTVLKACLARLTGTFFFFFNNFKTELFSRSLLLSCEAVLYPFGFFFFSCFSRAHRSHNFLFVFVLFLKCCILFVAHCVCTAVSHHANRSTSVLTCALFYLNFLPFTTQHVLNMENSIWMTYFSASSFKGNSLTVKNS